MIFFQSTGIESFVWFSFKEKLQLPMAVQRDESLGNGNVIPSFERLVILAWAKVLPLHILDLIAIYTSD